MGAALKDGVTRLLAYFKEMEKARRRRFIVLMAVAIVIIIVAAVMMTPQKSYSVLYSGMNPQDAGEVFTQLQSMEVDAKADGSNTILVESGVADQVRMQLAAEGYPKSGFNYEIFQNAAGLGATDMEKEAYYNFQVAEFLRIAICTLDKVEDAVVIINQSDEKSFVLARDRKPASASVILQLAEEQEIDNSEVRAIYEVVTKAVSGLQIENVRIIDNRMKLYELDGGDGSEIESLGTQISLQETVQQRLQRQVINLLAPVFGPSGVLAEVNVVLNFDTENSQTVDFDPPVKGNDEGLAVSIKELAEVVHGDTAGGPAGFDSNGNYQQYQEVLTDDNATYAQVSREANLEINETRTQIERAKGSIQDLSVAVILDSSENEEDYTRNVVNLIAKAVGVDETRISVEMLPFKKLDGDGGEDISNAFSNQREIQAAMNSAQMTRMIITIAAIIVVLLIIFLMIRTLKKAPEPLLLEEETLRQQEPVDVFLDDETEMLPLERPPTHVGDEVYPIEDREDGVRAQLEKYIDKSPASVAQLLRNWLADEPR